MATTVANRNRQMRQEQMREWLSKQKLIEKVIDIDREIGELEVEVKDFGGKMVVIEPDFALKKLRARADVNFRLIDKYLSDLKSVEATVENVGGREEELSDEELLAIATARSSDTSGAESGKKELH